MHILLRRPLAAAAAGSLGLTMVTVAPAVATVEPCVRETLRLPAGAAEGFLRAADPSGRYQVGDYRHADEQWRFALWRDGVPADLPLTGNTYPVDVNARGDVAGNASSGGWRGWRWRAGQVVDLPAPSGTAGANAVAINSRGEIAGESYDEEVRDQRVVVWSPANAVRQLPRPDGFDEAHVAGIDDDGTVVGTVFKWDYPNATVLAQRAVAWFSDGTWRFLPGTAANSFTEATAVRHGAVVGAERGGNVSIWSARSGDATVLTSGDVLPSDVNTSGSITLRKGVDNLLYQPGTGFRSLPQNDPAMGYGRAVGVTDDEQVYGSDSADGLSEAVRWTC